MKFLSISLICVFVFLLQIFHLKKKKDSMNFNVNLTSSGHLCTSECLRAAVHVTHGPALPRLSWNDQMVCSPSTFKLYYYFRNVWRIPTAITSECSHLARWCITAAGGVQRTNTDLKRYTNTSWGVWGDLNTIHEAVQPSDACFPWHHCTH